MKSGSAPVRRSLWAGLVLSLSLAAAFPTIQHVRSIRDHRAAERVKVMAESLAAPAPMTPLILNHDCNGEGLVACGWTSGQSVEALVDPVKADLAEVSTLPVRVRCSRAHFPRRDDPKQQSCLVQVMDGSHAVTVFLDPYGQTRGKEFAVLGVQYTVQAS